MQRETSPSLTPGVGAALQPSQTSPHWLHRIHSAQERILELEDPSVTATHIIELGVERDGAQPGLEFIDLLLVQRLA